MTFTDYILDIFLISVVFLQIRGRRLTVRMMLLPLGIVAWAASNYLKAVPTAGNDLVLIIGAATFGTLLGGLSGLFTSIHIGSDGTPVARARWAAAILWVVGMGTRFAFQLYASHGGAAAIGRFSAAHDITSGEAWVAALILMALGETLARTGVLGWRAFAAPARHQGSGWATRPSAIMVGSGRQS